MSAAAYARGSRNISRRIEGEIQASGVDSRIERQAQKEERARLLARIAELESRLARSERAREALRCALTAERAARLDERESSGASYRFAVRTLAKAAGLDRRAAAKSGGSDG